MNLEKRMRKMTIEEHYMKEAIRQAKKAPRRGGRTAGRFRNWKS